jgi:hypothetical protein
MNNIWITKDIVSFNLHLILTKREVLSVSHDFWGTAITYVGYFMLFFAMMSIMFTKHSRFADLQKIRSG